jgi:hypothetical protein
VSIVEVFGELSNALGVGFGLETEALTLEESLEFLVVRNDTVVNDCKLPLGIRSALVSIRAEL